MLKNVAMNKKDYVVPEIEIGSFEAIDVLALSGYDNSGIVPDGGWGINGEGDI